MLQAGTDILEISRIKDIVIKYGDKFLKRIYTPSELTYCLGKKNKFAHLAARFCAKEAVIKALNIRSLSYKEIEVKHINNAPKIFLAKNAQKKIKLKIKELALSLSHSDYYSLAFVLAKVN